MALESSGTMSIGGSTSGRSINLELGRPATQSSNLNESDLRTLAGQPGDASQISISDFYGASSFNVTGGTKFVLSGHTYHLFTSPGNLVVTGSKNTEYLIVGGGGGGGGYGGGGGGGVTHNFSPVPNAEPGPSGAISTGTYAITVGTGGASGAGGSPSGGAGPYNNGIASSVAFPGGTKTGGGGGHGAGNGEGGGSPHGSSGTGNNSNGGGGGYGPGSRNPGPGPGNGNAGGSGLPSNPNTASGGGGGGAGGAGSNATPGAGSANGGGDGGAGKAFPALPGPGMYPLLPSPVQSTVGTAWRDALGPTGLHAGGGAGGGGGSGGPGGGGSSGGGPGYDPGPGVNYTGGGCAANGTGGTGAVYIRYAN